MICDLVNLHMPVCSCTVLPSVLNRILTLKKYMYLQKISRQNVFKLCLGSLTWFQTIFELTALTYQWNNPILKIHFTDLTKKSCSAKEVKCVTELSSLTIQYLFTNNEKVYKKRHLKYADKICIWYLESNKS